MIGPLLRSKQHSLFDHLVGAGEQHGRHFEIKCSGGLQVEDEFELSGLHDRQVGGLRALEDLTLISPA